MITEVMIYLLFIYSLCVKMSGKDRKYDFHMLYLFSSLLLVAACSIMVNEYYGFKALIGMRTVLRFYVLYLALINLDMNEKQIRIINIALILIFVAQLPASAIRFMFYGVSERTIGTYADRGGGLTTIFPILILGYMVGYYAYFKKKVSYLLLAFCYALYGLAGAKRALIFLYPFFMFVLYYIISLREMKMSVAKHLLIFVIMICVTVGFVWINLEYNTSLAFEQNRNIFKGEQLREKEGVTYLLNYTVAYNKYSRLGGTVAAIDLVFQAGFPQVFFGMGPGSLTGSRFWNEKLLVDQRITEVRKWYGTTGFSHIVVEYGFTGVVILILFFLALTSMCWKYYKIETEPYWKAFATGSLIFVFLVLFDFLIYSNMCLVSDTLLPVFYYAMAVIRIRSRKRSKTNLCLKKTLTVEGIRS